MKSEILDMKYSMHNMQYLSRNKQNHVFIEHAVSSIEHRDFSTPVENIRQITPYLKKQTQFSPFLAQKRRFHKKQTQFHNLMRKLRTLRIFKLNIYSNKLEWMNFVKNSCIPEMEDNASEQLQSLLGVPR